MKNFILLVFVSLLLLSCSPKNGHSTNSFSADSLKLQYAKGFEIKYFNRYKEVLVYSPWVKNTVFARYYLVSDLKTQTPADGIKMKVPLFSIAATSVTHFEFLALLHELTTIKAVCSPRLIYNNEVRKLVEKDAISDLGDAFNINVEKTIQLKPGAVMMSGYNQNDPYAQRVSQAGIPVIFNNEWMETSLLARAEWIKFVAVFYNKEKEADSIFSTVNQQYNAIKDKVSKIKNKPVIMAGSNFRGTWYMPSGKNYMAKLFTDAGANYFYANDTTGGSLPLNVETVLNNFAQSDVWLNCSFKSLDELVKADSKHAYFRPVSLKQVYNFNNRLLPSSANDFWESAVARPDLLLSDVISILHPEVLPGYRLVYAKKLE